VMYAGKKVEEALVDELFARPQHPYTHGLLASIPRLDLLRGESDVRKKRLEEIKGIVPALTNLPPGCAFAPRCPFAIDKCRKEAPPYEEKQPGHWAACWRSHEIYGAAHA
jgi:peptide/nickel transport system ATP-binding protein